ncbi:MULTISPECIES: hypothetical protein [Arthrobacter]|uniref:hypothetical protein n=1 Tax=Arthrobacter TaxID=1663 RepID=UPI000A64AE32|nr:hypothetical protein [Arthrobacter sp. Edens01]
MRKRIAGAAAALLLGALLAGCGPTDAEVNEAQAIAEVKADPAPTPWEPRPCLGGEILQSDPSGTMQTIKPDCMDQALLEATQEFTEPLPPGVEWKFESVDYSNPEENPSLEMPAIMDGNQDTMVAHYWLCAWADSYLQSVENNDFQGQEQGMGYLAKYTQLPAVQAWHVDPEVFEANVITPAQAGDPAALQNWARSCPL